MPWNKRRLCFEQMAQLILFLQQREKINRIRSSCGGAKHLTYRFPSVECMLRKVRSAVSRCVRFIERILQLAWSVRKERWSLYSVDCRQYSKVVLLFVCLSKDFSFEFCYFSFH